MRGAILVLCSLFLANAAISNDYQLHRLAISDLTPDAISRAIHLDRKGILWLSLGGKAYRYEGYKLTEVTLVDEAGNALAASWIWNFEEDSMGQIWLLDEKYGPIKYDGTKRKFVLKRFKGDDAEEIAGATIMRGDLDLQLLLALGNKNVAVLDTGTSYLHKTIRTSRYLNNDDRIVNLIHGATDAVWVATELGVMLKCSKTTSSCDLIDLALLKGDPRGISVIDVVAWKPGSFAVLTKDHGVLELHDSSQKWLPKSNAASELELSQLFNGDAWGIHVSKHNGLLIATTEGLFGESNEGIFSKLADENGARNSVFVSAFAESASGITIAQSPSDLFILKEKMFDAFGNSPESSDSVITSFAQSRDDSIFVGSLNGLERIDYSDEGGDAKRSVSDRYESAGAELAALFNCSEDFLWIGRLSGGLSRLQHDTGKVSTINSDSDLDAISVITELESSALLVGSPMSGVHLLSKGGRVLINVSESSMPHSLPDNGVYSAVETHDNRILVSGDGGVTELHITDAGDEFEVAESRNYLHQKTALALLEASDRSIWVGTYYHGLFRAKPTRGLEAYEFDKVSTSPNLITNTVYSIEEDDFGLIWLGTNDGLVRLVPSSGRITTYDRTDGTIDDEFNLGASFKDDKGNLYFGGNKGFIRFDPGKLVERRIPPPLLLTEIMIHRKPVPYDPAYVDIPELVLTHNDHSLDVEFSTMDIISPGRSRYKYRLENFDDDWVDIGTRNSATFTSLPAGEYVLRVIGADSKGVWNYDGIVLPVRVLPAPWLTWWAFTFYALALLGFVALAKRSYDTYLQKVAATREAEQMKVTATLAMDDLQDQLEVENRLVDNLRKHASNAFDMVDEFLTMELEEVYGDDVEEPLGRARQRLHCLKALEASVYFQGDQLKVNFRDAIDRSFAEVIKANPHPVAELVLANDCSEELVPIDVAAPLLLLAHELMLNSVVHAFPESIGVECIEVKFQARAGGYQFELMDSGCGLPAAIDPTRPATMGMELIARIAERLGADLEVNREQGTHYRVSIPVETG